MPLTIFNLSKVDHLYIGKDTIVMFADTPEFETNNVEIASEDKKKNTWQNQDTGYPRNMRHSSRCTRPSQGSLAGQRNLHLHLPEV